MTIPKVLVANRGEIAIRILRSARELGWRTVAFYTTEPYLDASHASYADEAVRMYTPSDYMSVDAIQEIALHAHCTHVHPGYGFLSESPALACALAQHSIAFIGPSVDVLSLAGDKMQSRRLAENLGVQVSPGVDVATSDMVRAFVARDDVGYPVMIKSMDGGGGRGIRIVENDSGIEEALKRCMAESPSGHVFAEKALVGPSWKHIEIQIIGDGTGAVNHLWERECSVQRRFQKVVEFAPSRLPRSAILPLLEASLKMAGYLKYKGLGTFEYLVNSQTYQWVFLEINPRVQVEHTVTEEIMDIDLIRTQLLLFHPSPSLNVFSILSLDKPPSEPTSTAIQLRLTAENPENNFHLTPGVVKSSEVQWPAGRGVRVDTWLSSCSVPELDEWIIGTDFDSLLAKIIVRGGSYEEATQKARRALQEFRLAKHSNVKTNATVLAGILEHQDWKEGAIDTLWLERNIRVVLELGNRVTEGGSRDDLLELSGILERRRSEASTSFASSHSPGAGGIIFQPGTLFHLTISPASTPASSATQEEAKKHTLTLTSIAHNAFPEQLSGVLQSTLSASPLQFSLSQSTSITAGGGESFELADPNNPRHVMAPLTGKIVDMHPSFKLDLSEDEERKRVKKGEALLVLSVMKMESVVIAPYDGSVERIGKGVKVGAILGEGMLVCILRRNGTSRL